MDFAASLKNSAEITLLLAGQVILGLLALLAWPPMYAATMALPAAALVVLGQSMVLALPAWLLRRRLLPEDVIQWARPLPIPDDMRWRADAAVGIIFLRPLAIAYVISAGVWLYYWPAWLRPVWWIGLCNIAASLMCTWGMAVAGLMWHRLATVKTSRMRSSSSQARATEYVPRRDRLPWLSVWYRLFWLPFWRNGNPAGLRLTALWIAALMTIAAWLGSALAFEVPRPLFGAMVSVMFVMLTDRSDKAVSEQANVVRIAMAGMPIDLRFVETCARLFSTVPASVAIGAIAVAGLQHGASLNRRAFAWYVAMSLFAQLAIVGMRRLGARGRVILLVACILMLVAIGSEVWI